MAKIEIIDGIAWMGTRTATLGECAARIAELHVAIFEATNILHGLSMGTEGLMRGRVCSVSNRLDHAMGRTISSHGDQPCKACGKFDACECEDKV